MQSNFITIKYKFVKLYNKFFGGTHMKQKIITKLNTIKDDVISLSKYLYDNPEESFHEYKACTYIIDMLKAHKFQVKTSYLDIPTAFYAQYGTGHPKICYICEYDAMKDFGHVTGHNLLSSISIGAAISLSEIIKEENGSVIVLGCPGEFKGNSKITMVKQGTFDDIDIVLIAHPNTINAESYSSRAIIPIEINYRSSYGFNDRKSNEYSALDACLFTFNTLNLLKKGFLEGSVIDNILLSGDNSPYLMPNQTKSRFHISSKNMSTAYTIEKKIRELVKTAGFIMDIDSEIYIYESPCDELVSNPVLSRIFFHNLKESGIIDIECCEDTNLGLSLGSVSHIVPCIHPYISITEDKNLKYSSLEFASATTSYFAQSVALKTAQALALTGLDLIENNSLLGEVKSEFYNLKKRD
jgi:metal-dependent amidase/aminoacylase/carboxypeptidase family protein